MYEEDLASTSCAFTFPLRSTVNNFVVYGTTPSVSRKAQLYGKIRLEGSVEVPRGVRGTSPTLWFVLFCTAVTCCFCQFRIMS